jgi:hypothetical protein
VVVRPETCIEDPLFETEITLREIARVSAAFRCSRVFCEMWNSGDNAAPPMLHNLSGLLPNTDHLLRGFEEEGYAIALNLERPGRGL